MKFVVAVHVIEYVVRAQQSPGRARLICLTVLSSPAAIFVIVRSYNGLVPLSQSEERGVNSLKTDITGIGSLHSRCEAAFSHSFSCKSQKH